MKRDVSGILLLDKPEGISSNQALQKVRRLFGARKGGHTGSLDPLATGMLPICLGEATKVAGMLLGSGKAYRATAMLGVTTTTGDAEGEVVAEKPVPALAAGEIEAVLARFRGSIEQVPPAHSALKQGGEPLYKRVRRGETVVVPPRTVHIERLESLGMDGNRLDIEVECGSGTYIRSLVADLGEALGCGAHVGMLRRLWVAPFQDMAMRQLPELASVAEQHGPAQLDRMLLPVDAGLADLPVIDADADLARALASGRHTPTSLEPGLYRARHDGRLVALAEACGDGLLRTRRGFNLPDRA